MEYIKLADQEPRQLLPGYLARYVHTDNVTIQVCAIMADSPMPEHAHPHEQICLVMQGKFEMTVDGETVLLEQGSALVIPSNARHCGMPLSDCVIIDIFHPKREDFCAR